jgi:hypothetical protein
MVNPYKVQPFPACTFQVPFDDLKLLPAKIKFKELIIVRRVANGRRRSTHNSTGLFDSEHSCER